MVLGKLYTGKRYALILTVFQEKCVIVDVIFMSNIKTNVKNSTDVKAV